MMDRRTWAGAAGGFPEFLMIKESTDQPSAPSQIIVVQHFDDELKRVISHCSADLMSRPVLSQNSADLL